MCYCRSWVWRFYHLACWMRATFVGRKKVDEENERNTRITTHLPCSRILRGLTQEKGEKYYHSLSSLLHHSPVLFTLSHFHTYTAQTFFLSMFSSLSPSLSLYLSASLILLVAICSLPLASLLQTLLQTHTHTHTHTQSTRNIFCSSMRANSHVRQGRKTPLQKERERERGSRERIGRRGIEMQKCRGLARFNDSQKPPLST